MRRLVIRNVHIGDFILSLPALECLRRKCEYFEDLDLAPLGAAEAQRPRRCARVPRLSLRYPEFNHGLLNAITGQIRKRRKCFGRISSSV